MEKVALPCTMGDACEYVTPELGIEYALKLLDKHLLGVHEQGPAVASGPAAAPVKAKQAQPFVQELTTLI